MSKPVPFQLIVNSTFMLFAYPHAHDTALLDALHQNMNSAIKLKPSSWMQLSSLLIK